MFSSLDDLLMGSSKVLYLLKNGTSAFPTEIILNGKLYFIGRVFQLLDVITLHISVSFNNCSSSCKSCDDLISIIPQLGVRAEGLKELFTNRPGISKNFRVTDFAAIMKIVSKLVC